LDQLVTQQIETAGDLADLDQRVTDFISSQDSINDTIDSNLNTLSESMTALYAIIQSQVDSQANDISTILNTLTPSLTSRIAKLEDETIPAIDVSLVTLSNNISAQDAQYTALQAEVTALTSLFTTDIADLVDDITAINAALANFKSCSFGTKYKVQGAWYQDLTCGTSVTTIQVK
jgi:hypothetical protein